MTTEQKIDSFIQGMQCSTAQNIVVNIAGLPTNRTSFDTYYNAVASKLELALSLTNKPAQNETRIVNSLENRKRKGPKQDSNRAPKKPFSPENRKYSPTEWRALSSDQKKVVQSLHRNRKNNHLSNRLSNQNRFHAPPPQINLPPSQERTMVPYHQPHGTQFAHRQVSQQNLPYYYDNNRSVNSVILPPYPSGPIPPPPPLHSSDQASIQGSSGTMGSYFGGPYHQL